MRLTSASLWKSRIVNTRVVRSAGQVFGPHSARVIALHPQRVVAFTTEP